MTTLDRVRPRVLVTGLGVVSPLGNRVETFWEELVAGKSGVAPIRRFDASALKTWTAAEVEGFDPAAHADAETIRGNDPASIYLLAAAREAIDDAGPNALADRARVATIVGFDGALETLENASLELERHGLRGVDASTLASGLPVSATEVVARAFRLRGPRHALAATCASGAVALLQAWNLIRLGAADVAVAGGTSSLVRAVVAGFAAARVLSSSRDPAFASRPFDRLRDGFVIGEGAGAIVLERSDRALGRGAVVYAELAGGWQNSSIAGFTVNEPISCAACMQGALRTAATQPDEIDLVSAHATSTPVGDRQEAAALERVFGRRRVPVFAAKSALGHCMSAAGVLETAAGILAIRDGIAPPTINFREPDPECDVDCVPNTARPLPVRAVLKNSFGYGGINCCLVLRRWEP